MSYDSRRKTVAVANRERARDRRKEARLAGKCILLCGRLATKELNPKGRPYVTCANCRTVQKEHKEKTAGAME